MKILKQVVVFDTGDLAAESAFWAGFLGGTVEAEDDWHTLYVDGNQALDFQHVANHVKPDWPDGQPQQLHLDLYVDDIHAAEEKALSLGAKLLRPTSELDAEEGFRVYADPSGHPFCLCWNPAASA
ncbi:VOC family protein [Leifsonia bigeumensis]|uniref:VOC family protein n=1 Tax=Leifsonella bigeumensis TaxID=433643 RepID=A0ABP7FJE4_9MICO